MAAIGSIIKQFTGENELAETQQALVEAMGEIGIAKAEIFELEVKDSLLNAGSGSNLTVPIESVIDQKSFVRAYSSETTEQITDAVKEIGSAFLRGTDKDVLDGVSGIIGSLLDIFLGKSSASTGQIEEYYLVVEGLAFVRVDLRAWYMNVSAQSVYQVMKRVTVFVATKSSVDFAKLGFSTFLALYSNQLAQGKMTPEQIKAELEKAREIYELYRKTHGDKPADPIAITRGPSSLPHDEAPVH